MKANIIMENKNFDSFPQIYQNDYGTEITFELKNEDGSVYTLNTSDTVVFKARKYSSCNSVTTNQIDGECIITNTTSGIVVYNLTTSDTEVIGKFYTQLELQQTNLIVTAGTGDLVIIEEL